MFPERCGAARRARPGDVGRVLVVTLAGWVASLRRGRAGRVLGVLTVTIAVLSTVGLGAGIGAAVTAGWVIVALLAAPVFAAVLVVWPSATTAGFLLPGGRG